jgi:mRNA-degrading endonuclease toxin of MazEF toxin-antitoxin module
MSHRGDVVIVKIPFYDRPGSKDRPAVVVQCDRNNRRLLSTIVAGITTNLKRVSTEPTQFLVDPAAPEGAFSGLSQPSAVKCENLFTVAQTDIKSILGHFSDSLMQRLDQCLKTALEVP